MFNGDALRSAANLVFSSVGKGKDVEAGLQLQLLPVLETQGVVDRLETRLRHDRQVTINSKGPLFEHSKLRSSTQFMVFAVLEAAKKAGVNVRRSDGQLTVGSVPGGWQASGIPARGSTKSSPSGIRTLTTRRACFGSLRPSNGLRRTARGSRPRNPAKAAS